MLCAPFDARYRPNSLLWNSLGDRHPNLRYGLSTVVAGRSKALGSVEGFSKPHTHFASARYSSMRDSAWLSPPWGDDGSVSTGQYRGQRGAQGRRASTADKLWSPRCPRP